MQRKISLSPIANTAAFIIKEKIRVLALSDSLYLTVIIWY